MPPSQKRPSPFMDALYRRLYIDFFSGCGGLSLGLGYSGWNGLFAVEKDKMAFATFERNLVREGAPYRHFERWPSWLSKGPHAIEDVLDDPVVRGRLGQIRGKVALVAGGPPCQGFSVAGARNGNDPRNLLAFKQIQVVGILRPIFCLIENVGGFARKFIVRPIDGIAISVADAAVEELEALGYNVGKVKINAADFGVPQVRERVIIFGILKDFIGDIAAGDLLRDTLLAVGKRQRAAFGLPVGRYVGVGEAIGDLSGSEKVPDPEFPNYETVRYLPPRSAYQKLMRSNSLAMDVPNSHRFNLHGAKSVNLYKLALATQPAGRLSKAFLYENGCHSNKRFVLDARNPSTTLTTAPEEFIHYKHPRVVTLREMARLQSFPDDFEFLGRYTLNGPARGIDVPRNAQIGNAIPPLVGMALGAAIDEIVGMVANSDPGLAQYRNSADDLLAPLMVAGS